MSGTMEVTNVQRMLNSLGSSLVIDGMMGPKTKEAIKQFQLSHGMLPTGLVDSELVKALTKETTKSGEVTTGESFFKRNLKQIIIVSSVAIFGAGIIFLNSLRKNSK